jgi:hypothetical protein
MGYTMRQHDSLCRPLPFGVNFSHYENANPQAAKHTYRIPYPTTYPTPPTLPHPHPTTLLRLTREWLHLTPVSLALDATTLGNRWTVLAISVVVREGCLGVSAGGLWDRRRRSVGVLLLGCMGLLAKWLCSLMRGESEILGCGSGGEPE